MHQKVTTFKLTKMLTTRSQKWPIDSPHKGQVMQKHFYVMTLSRNQQSINSMHISGYVFWWSLCRTKMLTIHYVITAGSYNQCCPPAEPGSTPSPYFTQSSPYFTLISSYWHYTLVGLMQCTWLRFISELVEQTLISITEKRKLPISKKSTVAAFTNIVLL